MNKLFTTLIALFIVQLISAQSLTPNALSSTFRASAKKNSRLSATVGELNLREVPKLASVAAPAKTDAVTETPEMEVYPNPAAGFISFNFKLTGQGSVAVSLANSMGQKLTHLYNGSYDNGKISEQMDISTYAPGMYYLTLEYSDANGKLHRLTKKFQIA